MPSVVEKPSGGGDDGVVSDLQARVTTLQSSVADIRVSVARIEAAVAGMTSIMVTKPELMEVRLEIASLRADLFRALNEQTWKLIGCTALISAGTIAVAKLS